MTIPIFKLLNASDEVKSFLQTGNKLRAYEFGLAPDAPQKPYLVWQDISGVPQNHLDCPANTDHITIQIDIYTLEPLQLRTIREAVRKALELDNSCTVTDLRGNEREPITKLYRTGFDSNWFVDR
ncbi:DUF3168 domain-containing protein [Acinetobacter sp. C_4_1]|uniref:DUF3168 domain-containing protein n=1 Tax=unclassified Acinetobacter TaxID=196816 RepID=UPI0021B7EC05|nr:MULTISPECIES: DUF3168 domain-containing protein [unclassified Acinetobacter]MCT8090717.1 DUF3168 domain-containing protein [Acinetobacter sp. F_3_1]MCT8101551.1 DUF3168 domain-containing protein [Acinetobacter sp. C_4_1]MCT8135114.1 DUF3168 domain-containing protein [Acinetobacter sp. T_3_1]